MPSYYNDDFIDGEQEWEDVKWEKTEEEKTKKIESTINLESFDRQLISARQKSQYTINQLAQALSIKLKEYESYENGKTIPEKKIIEKINKILSTRLKV